MKRIFTSLIIFFATLNILAQGWPQKYDGVMLQGFYWDSFSDTKWTKLESQADELSQYFKLVWLPQSGSCGGRSMGYDDLYWFPGHYNSSFGTEAELRSLISTFKKKGIGTIADVVINHRRTLNLTFNFPKEEYKGTTYELTATDICADDKSYWTTYDGQPTNSYASSKGVTISSNNDTGEGWSGMPDLDHKSQNVQNNVKAYTKMLLDDLGYVGFRYDMVKGYAPEYTKMYNEYAQPQFSVGECWDGSNTIKNWIDGTGKTSAAFDFQFKYVVRNATDKQDWTYLNKQNDGNWPLISSSFNNGSYRRYAVTFVENHDTEVRPDGSSNGPLVKDIVAANAYMLAMPGTPCVFLKHWIDYKQDIKSMIDVRRAAGIHNESSYILFPSSASYYAVGVGNSPTDVSLLAVIGSGADSYTPNSTYVKVLSGNHYIYYLNKSLETAWVDLPAGAYDGQQKALLSAVSNSATQLVYTTDGSTPSASNGIKVNSGTTITLPMDADITLKVGLLIGGTVSGIVSRSYTKYEPEVLPTAVCTVNEGEVCAFFEAPASWTNDVSCWAWVDSPADNFTFANGGWPGVTCTLLGVADNGNKVWKWTWDGTKQNNTAATQPQKIIFSNTSSPQTADMNFTNGGYYNFDNNGKLVKVITATGIQPVTTAAGTGLVRIYTIDGHLLRVLPAGTSTNEALNQLRHGIYLINGKKYVK